MNEYLNRVGQPAPNSGRGPAGQPAPQTTGGGKKKRLNFNTSRVAFLVLVSAVTILLVATVAYVVLAKNKSISSQINTSKFQAVFLNSADGQVYFGKLAAYNNDYFKLSDIYYVRVEQVQPDKNQTAQQNISLAKLGSEIHGPEDVMYINKAHVLFWENLKDDGQVVKAIVEYRNNQAKNP
jgi:hypothetical protein